MGVYVNLHIMPEKIDPRAWAEMYDLSLEIIRNYPDTPAAGMSWKKKSHYTVLLYSRDLEEEVHAPSERRWHVVGDMESGLMAESFMLFRDLANYRDSGHFPKKPGTKPRDILAELSLDEGTGACDVFSSKTQGHPYHYSMLAVGMLVESLFSPYACVTGDINRAQAERVIREAGRLAGPRLQLPVCTVAEVLLARLAPFHQGEKLVEAAQDLYLGDRDTLWRALGAFMDSESLARSMKKMLNDYTSPDQIGFISLMTDWLNATKDAERLASMICLEADGPLFPADAFVRALISTWITTKPEHFSFLEPLQRPEDQAETVGDQLASIFTDMIFTGKDISLHIPPGELAEKMARVFPEQGKTLASIITEETEKNIAALRKQSALLRERRARPAAEAMALPDGENSSYEDRKSIEVLRRRFKALREACIKQHSFTEKLPGRKVLWRAIVRYAAAQQIDVREDAWTWIDREEDPQILLFLLILASDSSMDYYMEKARTRIFEDREFCLKLHSLLTEDEQTCHSDEEKDSRGGGQRKNG